MLPEGSLWTYGDVSERLWMAPSTLRKLVRAGGISFVKIGKSVRFRPGDIEAWVATKVQSA